MSVLLTAGQRKKKKRDSHSDEEREHSIASTSSMDCIGESIRSNYLRAQQGLQNSYMPSKDTAVWNFQLNGQPYSLALCLDSLTAWCNDQLVPMSQREVKNDSRILSLQLPQSRSHHHHHQQQHHHRCEMVINSVLSSSPSASASSSSLSAAVRQHKYKRSVPTSHIDHLSAATSHHNHTAGDRRMTCKLYIDGELIPQTVLKEE